MVSKSNRLAVSMIAAAALCTPPLLLSAVAQAQPALQSSAGGVPCSAWCSSCIASMATTVKSRICGSSEACRLIVGKVTRATLVFTDANGKIRHGRHQAVPIGSDDERTGHLQPAVADQPADGLQDGVLRLMSGRVAEQGRGLLDGADVTAVEMLPARRGVLR